MSYPVSGCVFIRNALQGFCLYESLASLLPLVSEVCIMDLGSTDGTMETLMEIAQANPKVHLILKGDFPLDANGQYDSNVFAILANELINDWCKFDNVLYWQADEIWHENLLRLMAQRFERGEFDLSFWRIQYANNFQYVKWFPHLVHHVGQKGARFNFVGDGMNTDRVWDAKICSNYGGEMFPKWGDLGQEGIKPYVNEMITDVSLIGAFRDNIPERRRLHAPFWHEEPTIPYYDKVTKQQPHFKESDWLDTACLDPDWTKTESPYNLPAILRYHVGKTRYELRPDLLQALKENVDYVKKLT